MSRRASLYAALGNAFQTLGERESGTASLEQAVQAYRAALEVHTASVSPLDWAATQNNLGSRTCCSTMGARESGTARWNRPCRPTALLLKTCLGRFTPASYKRSGLWSAPRPLCRPPLRCLGNALRRSIRSALGATRGPLPPRADRGRWNRLAGLPPLATWVSIRPASAFRSNRPGAGRPAGFGRRRRLGNALASARRNSDCGVERESRVFCGTARLPEHGRAGGVDERAGWPRKCSPCCVAGSVQLSLSPCSPRSSPADGHLVVDRHGTIRLELHRGQNNGAQASRQWNRQADGASTA